MIPTTAPRMIDTSSLYAAVGEGAHRCHGCGTRSEGEDPKAHATLADGSPCPVALLEAMQYRATLRWVEMGEYQTLTLEGSTSWDQLQAHVIQRVASQYRRGRDVHVYEFLGVCDLGVLCAGESARLGQALRDTKGTIDRERARREEDLRVEARVATLRSALDVLEREKADYVPTAYARRRRDLLAAYADVAHRIGEVAGQPYL